jgi:hypothetical protein
VGGIDVSSVALCSFLTAVALPAALTESKLSRLLRGCELGPLVSSLARTLPTPPDGGRTSRSFACRSFMGDVLRLAWGAGRRGLWRAAASRAAMFEGEGPRVGVSGGGASECELCDLLPVCTGDRLLTLRGPVQSRVRGAELPAAAPFRGPGLLPTLVAASNAPLPSPVYVLVRGFGLAGGLEKARKAPCRAASLALYWVSPVLWLPA